MKITSIQLPSKNFDFHLSIKFHPEFHKAKTEKTFSKFRKKFHPLHPYLFEKTIPQYENKKFHLILYIGKNFQQGIFYSVSNSILLNMVSQKQIFFYLSIEYENSKICFLLYVPSI